MTHFVLVDMGRKRGMKNYFVLTKRELQWSLDLENVDHRLKSKPYSFTKDSSDAEERERFFKFRTRKEPKDFFGARVRTIAKGNKNSVMSKYMRSQSCEWKTIQRKIRDYFGFASEQLSIVSKTQSNHNYQLEQRILSLTNDNSK